MSESLLLELVNGNFFILSICAVIIFTHYIVMHWSEGYLFLSPSISLWALFMGEIYLRANFWFARHMLNAGFYVQPSNFMTITGSIICSWALLCMIAVFAPSRWRTRAWTLSLFVTIVFNTAALIRIF